MANKFWRRASDFLRDGQFDDEADEDPDRRAWESSRQVGSVVMVGLIIAVLVGLAFTGAGSPTAAPRAEVALAAEQRDLARVPEVTGLTQAEAVRTLRKAGFEGTISVSRADERFAKGVVANQVPAPGTEAPQGSTIELALSLGPADREVPALVGYPAAGALSLLQRAGLGYSATSEVSDLPFGTVLRSTPAAGTQVAKGTEVALVVSSGPLSWLDGLPVGADDGLAVLDASIDDSPPANGSTGGASPAPNPSPPPASTGSPAPARPPATSPPPTSPPPTSPPPTSPPPTSPPPTSPPTTTTGTCIWMFAPSGPFQYCS